MDTPTIDDKIRLKQLQVQIEQDPIKKAELQGQLRKLQLQKEVEAIKTKIGQISN